MELKIQLHSAAEIKAGTDFMTTISAIRDKAYADFNASPGKDFVETQSDQVTNVDEYLEELSASWKGRRATAGTLEDAKLLGKEFKIRGLTVDEAPETVKRNAQLLSSFLSGLEGSKPTGTETASDVKGEPEAETPPEETAEDAGSDDSDLEGEETTIDDDLDGEEPETGQDYSDTEVKTALKKFRDEFSVELMREVMKDTAGTIKFSEVPESKYGALMRGLEVAKSEQKAKK